MTKIEPIYCYDSTLSYYQVFIIDNSVISLADIAMFVTIIFLKSVIDARLGRIKE